MAFTNQYVATAIMVATFKTDRQIRYKVREIEAAFNGVLAGQAANTNVADTAPSSIPRLTLLSGPKQISVSQNSVQLDMNFMEQGKSIANTLPIVKKNFLSFWDGICSLKAFVDIREVGMVLSVYTPRKLSAAELGLVIFEKYSKASPIGDVASASLQFGFLDIKKQIFQNISVGHYESRGGFISGEPGKTIELDIDDLKVVESGFETKLDVNTKPLKAAGVLYTKELGTSLFVSLSELAETRAKEFLDW